MRRYLLATAAAVIIATPAAARDNSGYVGLEGGVMFPRSNHGDALVDFTTTQTPATPVLPVPLDQTFDNIFSVKYKTGYDVDLIGGYDFGMFRLEGELGYKRSSLKSFRVSDSDIATLNTILNRPSVAPDPGAPGLPALSSADLDLNGHVSVLSGMVNALLDVGDDAGFGAYAGGGFGRARVKLLGDSDNAWAWQVIAGLRYAISPNIDVGLKYRYFQTGKLDFADDSAFALSGNPALIDASGTPVTQTTNAVVATDFSNKFRSHSLLLSLVYNFAAAEAPPQ